MPSPASLSVSACCGSKSAATRGNLAIYPVHGDGRSGASLLTLENDTQMSAMGLGCVKTPAVAERTFGGPTLIIPRQTRARAAAQNAALSARGPGPVPQGGVAQGVRGTPRADLCLPAAPMENSAGALQPAAGCRCFVCGTPPTGTASAEHLARQTRCETTRGGEFRGNRRAGHERNNAAAEIVLIAHSLNMASCSAMRVMLSSSSRSAFRRS
jgi:hypothetical protein